MEKNAQKIFLICAIFLLTFDKKSIIIDLSNERKKGKKKMNYYLILDTETTNDIDCPICYDIGWCITDENKNVIKTRSYVVAETFLDEDLMANAFFKDKIPQYLDEIDKGERQLCKLDIIRIALAKDMANFGIDTIIAHNARFDYRSCQTTQRYFTNSKYRWFFPYGTKFCDTLAMARQSYKNDNNYRKFCTENDLVCGNGQPRFTAEVLTRFFNNNTDFIESHTGLEDCLIEKEIFFKCLEKGCEPLFLWE